MNDDKYWPYATARTMLKTRLQATDEEINIWTYLGHADGGIDAFDDPNDYLNEMPPRLHFTASEVGAFFLREQIESFTPDNSRRYLTLRELIERWKAHDLPTDKVQDLVKNKVDDGRLEPINVMRGHSTKVINASEDALIPDLSVFVLDQVLSIEGREFRSLESAPKQTDYSTWATKSSLIDAFKQYGLTEKKFNNGGAKWITDARRLLGSGGRGRSVEPMFCPFTIMQGLVNKARPKKLEDHRGWAILESKFPTAYKKHSDQDPRQYDE